LGEGREVKTDLGKMAKRWRDHANHCWAVRFQRGRHPLDKWKGGRRFKQEEKGGETPEPATYRGPKQVPGRKTEKRGLLCNGACSHAREERAGMGAVILKLIRLVLIGASLAEVKSTVRATSK